MTLDMRPLVSVIIPAYNVEKTLLETVQSVLNQTYESYEIWIVDDGSTDRTYEIMKDLEGNDSRIHLIQQKNKGLSGARNSAINKCNGDYIAFLDGDDLWHKSMLEVLVSNAVKFESDYVSSNFIYYYGEERNETEILLYGVELSKKEAIDKLISNVGYCSACAKLYSRELWKELRYPEEIRFAEDMFLGHELIHRANKIVHVNEGFYYYRQDDGSLTRSTFNERKLHMIEGAGLWVEYCKREQGELVNKALAYYWRVVIHYFTLFARAKRWDIYSKYQSELRTAYKSIMTNPELNSLDRLRATSLSVLPGKLYKKIRELFRK